MRGNNMTLLEFVELEKIRLEDFKKMWLEHAKENEKCWPLEMNVGDWEEQFSFFMNDGK